MRDIVNNYRDYADDYRFIVASVSAQELWFYGAYDDKETAHKAAEEIDGVVLENIDWY